MQSPEKGKAMKNLARARRVARKQKKPIQAKFTGKGQRNTRDSKVSVETVECMDTKLLIVGKSSRPNLKVKPRARESRNPKSQKSVNVTAVNKSKKLGHQKRLHRRQVYLK